MTEKRYWMKEPCGPCPFSRSKTLPLHPERANEFAAMAQNPYSSFPCHKTADLVEETDFEPGGYVHGDRSFVCNGFLSLQVSENANGPDGFEPHSDAFEDSYEMAEHHLLLWQESYPDYEPV